ncbi:MAG: NAD-dependent epimerase/dehydratase family protein [Candidatus Babeliaceae bacterium]|nr:NAD-dependent epimerase/dehydratase family protein [Candidatus Babeliaceae bacterium]
MEKFYKNKSVLVTGGAGFIGSHLCEKLLNIDANIRILDNLRTGTLDNIKNIEQNSEFINGSICSLQDCLTATAGIDTVFHLAAEISVAQSQKNPYQTCATNIQGTYNLLEACRTQGVKTVIFASSAAVYGNHEGICSENIPPSPVSTYGYSKLIGEQLCQLYSKNYGLKTVSLRFFNVYGSRQNTQGGDGGVLAVLDEKLKNNIPITIFGDGLQTRDFVPVETVVQSLLLAGMLTNRWTNGQPFNIATGTSVTLKSKLEELLEKYPAYSGEISYLPDRIGDIRHSQADCSKFQKAVQL